MLATGTLTSMQHQYACWLNFSNPDQPKDDRLCCQMAALHLLLPSINMLPLHRLEAPWIPTPA